MLSPGVTIPLAESRARLVGRGLSAMSMSPSESREALSEEPWSKAGSAGAGGRIEIAMAKPGMRESVTKWV